MSAPRFTWPVRVYWEDTDGGGVVYHARYVQYFERARTEWLRALGIDQAELQREHDLVFAIRDLRIAYLRPARMDDLLQVSAEPEAPGRASLRFRQVMRRDGEAEPIATAEVYAACLRASRFRPCRLPDALRARLAAAISN
jgi:acyl-CoA thioester hydrolase